MKLKLRLPFTDDLTFAKLKLKLQLQLLGAVDVTLVKLTVELQLQLLFAVDLTMVNLNLKLQPMVANDLTCVDKFLFCTLFLVFLVIFIVNSDQADFSESSTSFLLLILNF